jgi:hypothetical protein
MGRRPRAPRRARMLVPVTGIVTGERVRGERAGGGRGGRLLLGAWRRQGCGPRRGQALVRWSRGWLTRGASHMAGAGGRAETNGGVTEGNRALVKHGPAWSNAPAGGRAGIYGGALGRCRPRGLRGADRGEGRGRGSIHPYVWCSAARPLKSGGGEGAVEGPSHTQGCRPAPRQPIGHAGWRGARLRAGGVTACQSRCCPTQTPCRRRRRRRASYRARALPLPPPPLPPLPHTAMPTGPPASVWRPSAFHTAASSDV